MLKITNKQKYIDIFSALFIALFVLIAVFVAKIEIYPFNYSQEISVLVIGRLPENIGQHPLFYKDSFLPLLHYLPPWLLNNTGFIVASVLAMAAAPWMLVFATLRKLSIPSLAALVAVIVTFYIGSNYGLAYLQEPNPFMIFRSVNFRMIIFPLLGLFLYLCATRRWLLAGLTLGLVAASHAKLGAKIWLLTCLILFVLAVWKSAPNPKPTWKGFFALQSGFVLTFAFTAWQLFHASTYFSQLTNPRAHELISPFGFLLKNEPDDFLFLFNSSMQVYGAFVFVLAGTALSLWLMFRGKIAALRSLATIGLIANVVSLMALTFEVWFEKAGMSYLPWLTMLKVFLLRPWDFLWVGPLSIGILGCLAFAIQPTRTIGKWLSVGLVLICTVGAFRTLTAEAAPWSLIDPVEHTPSAVQDYTVLTVCSSSKSLHESAKAEAVDALWRRDRNSLEKALQKMNLAFNSANKGRFAWLISDPEADNLRAMFEFRVNDYAQGYADLLSQNNVILYPAVEAFAWMGDVVWECADDMAPETIGFKRILRPWKDYSDAVEWIKSNAAPRSRVIQMPSLAPVIARTKRISFWETKIDSHPMYSFPEYYGIGLDRLQSIAGPNSIELTPGFRYGDAGEAGRRAFLSLTKEDFKKINEKYGAYEFILTERQHKLDLPMAYSNDSYAIYRQGEGSN